MSYDFWRTGGGYPREWDFEQEESEVMELDEKFSFAGLTYRLVGKFSGDDLGDATLYLLTHWGRVEQDWCTTDETTEAGYNPAVFPPMGASLTDACFAVAEAAWLEWS